MFPVKQGHIRFDLPSPHSRLFAGLGGTAGFLVLVWWVVRGVALFEGGELFCAGVSFWWSWGLV